MGGASGEQGSTNPETSAREILQKSAAIVTSYSKFHRKLNFEKVIPVDDKITRDATSRCIRASIPDQMGAVEKVRNELWIVK
jgi:hypothetical protein